MAEDLSTWLTIEDMAAATGKGRRTIERLVERHAIHTAKDRRQDGRKPVTVIDPAEVMRLSTTPLRPVVQSVTVPAIQRATPPAVQTAKPATNSDMVTVLQALTPPLVPVAQKLFLSEEEAALYLGFPKEEIKRLRKSGALPSLRLKNRSWRVRRVDVEAWAATPLNTPVAGQHEHTGVNGRMKE